LAIVEGEGAVDNLIGEKILPSFGVNSRNAHFIKATLADTQGLRSIAADKYIHAPGTVFERMTAKIGDDSFDVTLRGLEVVIPNEVQMDYAEYLDIELLFMRRFGMEVSGLTKEALVAAAVFNTTNFGSATNSTTAYTVANLATMTPISDIVAAIRRVRAKGEAPDTVAMSGPVYERIRQSAEAKAWITGTLGAGQQVTQNSLQQALAEFGIKQVLVGDSYQNTAADGATPSLAQLWSNTYIWVGKAGRQAAADTEGVNVPTLAGAGALIYWEEYQMGGKPGIINSMTFDGGSYVESYPESDKDSEVVRVKMSHKPYTSGTRSGDLIATQYA
jgi:hypothetical protein